MSNQIGLRIREARKLAGYPTQESLALALRTNYGFKTDRPMVSKWESGKQIPEMYTIKCLAELCEVSTDYLCGKAEKPTLSSEDGLNEEEAELVRLYKAASPALRAAALAVLKSGGGQGATPGEVSVTE